MNGSMYLSCPATVAAPAMRETAAPSDAWPKEIAGQPVRYIWRPSIRTGQYTHPATGQRFSVSTDRMNKWIENFRRMKSNGHRVYVPLNHSAKVQDNRGYVLDMRRNGDWLEELHQYIGDDAIRDAARSRVSLNIVPNLKDGFGNVYDEAIEHSSLVVNPVILGQAEPVLAASGGTSEPGQAFVLSAETAGAEQPVMNLSDATVTALKALLGSDVSADNMAQRVSDKINAGQTALSACQQERDGLKLAATAPAGVSLLAGHSLSAMVTAAKRAKDHAVSRGAINPDTAGKLEKLLIAPAKDKQNVLALSASGLEDESAPPLALAVFEALGENKPVALGAQSGVQVLNRNVPGGEAGDEAAKQKSAEDANYEAGKRAAEEANGKRR